MVLRLLLCTLTSFLLICCQLSYAQGIRISTPDSMRDNNLTPYYLSIGTSGNFIGAGAILDPEKIDKYTHLYERFGAINFAVKQDNGYETSVRAAYYGYGVRYGKISFVYAELGGLVGSGRACEFITQGTFGLPDQCEDKGFAGIMPEVGLQLHFNQDVYMGFAYRHIELLNDAAYIPDFGIELGFKF